jgi:hypothetical protein
MSWVNFAVAAMIVVATIVAVAAWPRRAAIPPVSRRTMQRLLTEEETPTNDPDGTA